MRGGALLKKGLSRKRDGARIGSWAETVRSRSEQARGDTPSLSQEAMGAPSRLRDRIFRKHAFACGATEGHLQESDGGRVEPDGLFGRGAIS